jgi:hypothetical protein
LNVPLHLALTVEAECRLAEVGDQWINFESVKRTLFALTPSSLDNVSSLSRTRSTYFPCFDRCRNTAERENWRVHARPRSSHLRTCQARQDSHWYIFIPQASEIQDCAPVWRLSLLKTSLEADESPVLRKIFAWLFPFGPAWNSILGTFYISSYAVLVCVRGVVLTPRSVPNFILAFIPAQINGNTLNTMTAFAVSPRTPPPPCSALRPSADRWPPL